METGAFLFIGTGARPVGPAGEMKMGNGNENGRSRENQNGDTENGNLPGNEKGYGNGRFPIFISTPVQIQRGDFPFSFLHFNFCEISHFHHFPRGLPGRTPVPIIKFRPGDLQTKANFILFL